jgi:hypothetical protein
MEHREPREVLVHKELLVQEHRERKEQLDHKEQQVLLELKV